MGRMAVERIVATAAIKICEKTESSRFSQSLIAVQWAISFASALYLEILDARDENSSWDSSSLQLTCSLIYTHATVMFIVFIIGVSGFFTFAAVLFYLYRHNTVEYSKRGIRSLATRCQLSDNMINLRGVIYTTVYYCLCVLLHVPLWTTFRDDLKHFTKGDTRDNDRPQFVGVDGRKLTFSNKEEVYLRKLQENWQ